MAGRERPLPEKFLEDVHALEAAYLSHDDPIRQSGFGGGSARWREERVPILEAVDGDGDLLDAGCANGYLLQCLVGWAAERGIKLTPQGVDIGPRLIAQAKRRLPEFSSNFHVANAWEWEPPRRYRYVYALVDCVPREFEREYLHRLLDLAVKPGGRLVVGEYGSRSHGIRPKPMGPLLASYGIAPTGTATGGSPPLTSFAWTEHRPRAQLQRCPMPAQVKQGPRATTGEI